MSLLEEHIQNWIINETNGLIEGRLRRLPNISSISRLTQGKNSRIWKFVIKHVRSKQSVVFTKRILELKQVEKEHEKYPDTDRKDYIILKNKVNTVENKVRFIENSVKDITKHISFINSSLEDAKEENCVLHQKCSILELVTMDLKEKNESLKVITEKLYTLINNLFSNEKTKCFKKPFDTKSSKNISKINLDFSDDNFKSIINEMMFIVKHKLIDEKCNSLVTNLVEPVTKIMSYTLTIDLINQIKHISQQDFNSLQSNFKKEKFEDVKRMSEIYLLSMKQDFLDSCFQRKKLESTECSFEISDKYFDVGVGKLQSDYVSLCIQNECLADSIQYLEKQLTTELDLIKCLTESNAKQKSQCADVKIIMQTFHKQLNAVHLLFDLMPRAFSSIKLSFNSCRKFIDTQVLCTIKCDKTDCLTEVVNKIDFNYKLYLELLKNKDFLQDFLKDFTFVKLDFPVKVWEFLALEPFQNRHLLIEVLARIKTKLSMEPNHFQYEQNKITTLLAKQLISSVENNIDSLEVVEKNLYEVKRSCKNLEIVLKDWWHQDAQYIPKIEHNGKTLKMWLAILNVLE